MLRLAKQSDLEILFQLCLAYYKSSAQRYPIDNQYGQYFLESHLCNQDHLSLIWDQDDQPKGCLLAFFGPHPFCPMQIANELVWWMEPGHRGRGALELFRAFEYWAIEIKKCDIICVTSMPDEDPRLEDYYKRKGYTMKERTWSKEI